MMEQAFAIGEEGEEAEAEVSFFDEVEGVDLNQLRPRFDSPFPAPAAG